MIDPESFFDDHVDPSFFVDEDPEDFFDAYDQFDEGSDTGEDDDYGGLSADELAIALALGETIGNSKKSSLHEVDENTDRENFEAVQKLISLKSRHERTSRLRPFEQYVEDICQGRRSLFDD
jgi:hypothetical protein